MNSTPDVPVRLAGQRLPQFSLATFLVAMLVLGASVGFLGRRIVRERRALAELRGTWQGTAYLGDEDHHAPVAITIALDGYEGTMHVEGVPHGVFRFAVDSTKNPMWIDFSARGGSRSMGIYRVTTHGLTICQAQPGKPRPSGFAIDRDGDNVLTVLVNRAKARMATDREGQSKDLKAEPALPRGHACAVPTLRGKTAAAGESGETAEDAKLRGGRGRK